MKLNALGTGGLKVAEICLGTMTFGQQNTLDEACSQLDYALDRGVNFIDAAEMYPVPTKAETYGRTEEFIGHWLKTQTRSDRHQGGGPVAQSRRCYLGAGREPGV